MYAIVDVGSNTVRMNIYKLENDKFHLVMSKKEPVGLASYVRNGRMLPEGINRCVEILTEFKNLADDLEIKNFRVFATAALRNAKNSKAAVDEIVERSGADIEVISGEMEAEFDFIGASTATDMKSGLMVDIGGGSTELIIFKDGKMKNAVSIPMGSLNTYDKFVAQIIPTKAERKAIKKAVIKEISQYEFLKSGEFPTICGIGGTARAANKMKNSLFEMPLNHNVIKTASLKKMIKLLENDEDEKIPKEPLDILLRFVPDRVRTILPGMIILNTIAKYYHSDTIEVTNAGVRDGFLYSRVLPQAKKAAKPAAKPAAKKPAPKKPAAKKK